ncbi:Kef-type potassium/proton antiporter (CPA2 family) [Rhodovulum imhoffii]|uniref:Kef-type potassium/proton antiporter (CPA2 family) n=1 Tax=Rhodovulum imhoffii TaxID=365340 RepID=A0A2T5BR67_9RHOB|nr:cation:proton antiporter [Rhodovulum imhoffii]MBK5934391.1 potassium transporter [Rhodovulum imhoffii]PTN01737.1 Kef-type potassium/proton antiporter (CPA2 family) [Rhodovulum imhoffii]
MESFLLQATIYLGAAVIAVPLAARLGLGSVLGYLVAGIVIGPMLGLVGNEMADLQHFAEFGVVMMLFLIGLELEPRALWDMRHRLLGLGGLQIVLTTGAVMGGGVLLDLPPLTALAVGMTLALSSTAIVLQTLSEKGLMHTGGGRATFSVLLTQDIAVIPMLAILPLLAVSGGAFHTGDTHESGLTSLVDGLPAVGVTLVTLTAVASVVAAGHYLTRPLFRFIHATRLREMYTAVALLIVVGIAIVMIMVGLSPALGTFLAGVVLANSEFRHELESDIQPFKGMLLGLFFITVGAGINFGVFLSDPVRLMGLTLALIVIKGILLFVLGTVFRLRGRDRWLFTLGLAQAGEFGFVLVSFGSQQGVMDSTLSQQLLLVIALSMLITPLLFILYEVLSKRIVSGSGETREPDMIDEQNAIIIAGIGRFGQVVNRMLQVAGFRATVLDHDLATIELMRKFGFKAFFGDPTRPELLHAAGLGSAKVLVAALGSKEATTHLVTYARRERPDLHIVARAHDRVHVYELYRAGANDIVREMFDSSLRAARYVLENMGLSEFEANETETAYYHHDRKTLRELADLWNPDLPLEKNDAYVRRAQELNTELETALVSSRSEQHQSGDESSANRDPG